MYGGQAKSPITESVFSLASVGCSLVPGVAMFWAGTTAKKWGMNRHLVNEARGNNRLKVSCLDQSRKDFQRLAFNSGWTHVRHSVWLYSLQLAQWFSLSSVLGRFLWLMDS